MKFSLLSVDTSKSVVQKEKRTGMDLRPPYPPDAMRVPAEAIRDYQEFRHLAERMNRSMDAATVDNFTQDLRGSYGDANTELYPYNYTVRARSRTLAKNTSHGKGIMRVYADNVVGDDPFELEMKVLKRGDNGKPVLDKNGDPVEDKEVAEAICEAWGIFRWQENFTVRKNQDFMEALRVAEMARKRDGLAICRMYPNYKFNDFGFAVDFLERDHLQEQWSGFSPSDGEFGSGNPIVGSIEQHPEFGFALAYWLLRRHPGNAYSIVVGRNDQRNFREQVPAENVIIMDNPRTRPEQDTGDTELDATILPLWRIHQYDKSLTLSSIASASKPWWIEEDRPTGLQMPGDSQKILDAFSLNYGDQGIPIAGNGQPDPAAVQNGDYPKRNVVRPASREELPPGKKLKQADPKFPIEAAHTFRQDNERDLATGTHGSYAQMSGDYQNLGFVAGLMSQIPFQRNVRVNQKTMIEDLRPMFRMWLKCTILKGYFEKKGVFVSIQRLEEFVVGAHFKGQQAEFLNPLSQAQTLILLSEAGHLTDQQLQDALPNGITTDKLYMIKKAEQDRKLELGLMAPSMVAAMPSIAHEGTAAPGEERPTDSTTQAPKAAGTQPGGAADAPPKSKVQRPGVNRSRIPGTIDDTTKMLLEMSQNGH